MPITRIAEPALDACAASPDLTVHSVFDSAVNLRAGPRLVTCTARRLSAPHGIEMSAADLLGLRDHGRRRSAAPLRWDSTRRRISNAAGRLSIVAAPNLTVFDPTLPTGAPDGWERAVSDLIGYLTRTKPVTGFGDDWRALCSDGRFDDAIASIVAGQTGEAVLHWLGRGPGLTPSGDDVIVGVIATLWSAGAFTSGRLATLRRSLDHAASERTTDISAEYLYHACRGMVAGPLHQLLTTLHRRDSPATIEAVNRLRNFGHTSGIDSVLGVILAWRTVLAPAPSDRNATMNRQRPVAGSPRFRVSVRP
jgi:hypothetical protein